MHQLHPNSSSSRLLYLQAAAGGLNTLRAFLPPPPVSRSSAVLISCKLVQEGGKNAELVLGAESARNARELQKKHAPNAMHLPLNLYLLSTEAQPGFGHTGLQEGWLCTLVVEGIGAAENVVGCSIPGAVSFTDAKRLDAKQRKKQMDAELHEAKENNVQLVCISLARIVVQRGLSSEGTHAAMKNAQPRQQSWSVCFQSRLPRCPYAES